MFNLYKDPEGENIFTGTHSSAAVPGIAAGATSILTGIQPGNSSSLRKESIGINMALSTLGDDPKATIAVLEAKVLELEEELRNSKMVREHIYVSFYPPSLSLLSFPPSHSLSPSLAFFLSLSFISESRKSHKKRQYIPWLYVKEWGRQSQ